jgi:D-ribose pyranase
VKQRGILHAELAGVVAALGHHDLLVIGDAGLPVPKGVRVIDLALRPGVPPFLEALETVLEELHVQEGVIDSEMASVSPSMREAFERVWPADLPLREVPHGELLRMTADATAIVRTGEFTPYANVVLVAGVPF